MNDEYFVVFHFASFLNCFSFHCILFRFVTLRCVSISFRTLISCGMTNVKFTGPYNATKHLHLHNTLHLGHLAPEPKMCQITHVNELEPLSLGGEGGAFNNSSSLLVHNLCGNLYIWNTGTLPFILHVNGRNS